MTKLQIKGLIILITLVVSTYFLYHSILYYTSSKEKKEEIHKRKDKILDKIIHLGLDLKGGTYLLLEIDESKLEKKDQLQDSQERAIEIIRNRIDQYGVTEPFIAKQGEKWINVQLPGIKDPDKAKELIGKTALLEFRLVDDSNSAEKIGQKIRELNLSIQEAAKNPEILKLTPTGYTLLPGKEEGSFVVVKSSPELTGAYLVGANVRMGGEYGLPYVSLDFNKDGAKIFANVTGANINRNLAIVLDNVVQSAPVIRSRIPDGKAVIEGNFTIDDAKFLATILRAGALPAPLNIIEERSIGPSLGEDFIRGGQIAFIIGFVLVSCVMIFYYGFSGWVSTLALFLNVFFIIAALSMFRATLTLPGIAGIILMIGMAVDANILILERLKEELEAKKTLAVAIDAAYSRAWITIFDSNLTTLIAAVFLFQFGTGPIRGFAVTLSLGLIINLYTSVFITKAIYEYLLKERAIVL